MTDFELIDNPSTEAVIKVVGVGGCGCNAIDHMLSKGIEGVDFIATNTDAQALQRNKARTQMQLGTSITKGLGAGANPKLGREAAVEDGDRIRDMLEKTDMLFLTAGMGGGTGTGAAPVFAQIAKEMGILTVAVVTKPFVFEGTRLKVANEGIELLSEHVDSLITIPNDKLMQVLGDEVTILDAFESANGVLHDAVSGIAEVIKCPGLVNVDFADVKTVMSEMGMAMMGSAISTGESRAIDAANKAISSPLLEDINLKGAKGVLINITSGNDLKMREVHEIMSVISQYSTSDATVIVGTVIDDSLEGSLRVTIVATGIDANTSSQEVHTSSNNSIFTDNNSNRDNSKIAEVENIKSDPVIDDNDIPAFLRKRD